MPRYHMSDQHHFGGEPGNNRAELVSKPVRHWPRLACASVLRWHVMPHVAYINVYMYIPVYPYIASYSHCFDTAQEQIFIRLLIRHFFNEHEEI